MKKIFTKVLVLAMCMLAFNKLSAQDIKGQNFLNAGIGVGAVGFSGKGGIPIAVSFEHGFGRNISAGLGLGFVQTNYDYHPGLGYGNDWRYTYYVFGVRGSYHFNEVLNIPNEKWDLYGGASLMYRHFTLNTDDYDYYGVKNSGGGMDLGIHVASRYMFNPKVGAYAELGYGISALQLGIVFKP